MGIKSRVVRVLVNKRFQTLLREEACCEKDPPVKASPCLDWCYNPLNLALGERKEKRRGYLVPGTGANQWKKLLAIAVTPLSHFHHYLFVSYLVGVGQVRGDESSPLSLSSPKQSGNGRQFWLFAPCWLGW